MPKRFHIQTVGCQMNVLDSELVAGRLLEAGYELAESAKAADVILFNTCSVRQHAEDKVYSALGRLKHVKEHHSHKIIGRDGMYGTEGSGVDLQASPARRPGGGPRPIGTTAALVGSSGRRRGSANRSQPRS